MSDDVRAALPRCLAVWAGVSLGAVGVVVLALPSLAPLTSPTGASDGPARPDLALAGGCAALALLVTAWLWCVTGVVTLGAWRGHTGPLPGVPAPLRRVLLAGCGVALAGGLALPAGATPGAPHEDRTSLAGLPFPDRAVAALPGGAVLAVGHPASRPVAPETVRVAPGDSLWVIAAEDLGPAATDAEVDARWRAIYALNRGEIGPDPDLICPAQRLRLA